MANARAYLIVNGKGDLRVTKRRPRLSYDEVAFPISVQIPPGWGYIYDATPIELTLPPAPPVTAPVIGQPEQDIEEP